MCEALSRPGAASQWFSASKMFATCWASNGLQWRKPTSSAATSNGVPAASGARTAGTPRGWPAAATHPQTARARLLVLRSKWQCTRARSFQARRPRLRRARCSSTCRRRHRRRAAQRTAAIRRARWIRSSTRAGRVAAARTPLQARTHGGRGPSMCRTTRL